MKNTEGSVSLCYGQIAHGLGIFAHAELPGIRHLAHHFHKRRISVEMESFSEGAFARPEMASHRPVDDRDRFVFLAVEIGKRAAGYERDTNRLKVRRGNIVEAGE